MRFLFRLRLIPARIHGDANDDLRSLTVRAFNGHRSAAKTRDPLTDVADPDMCPVRFFGGFRIETLSVVADDDLVKAVFLFRGNAHYTVFCAAHAVTDRVLNEGLYGQRGDHEARIRRVVLDPYRRETNHLDLGINARMLEFLFKRDQLRAVERVYVLPQISSELFRHVERFLGGP